ncbi:tRNA (N6-threonylcarbamoyladenosine(37)-N6)-methyltransferase TrmO [Desulfosarcina sp.]|uniref:tRNA (N6-threonylcarbamoyladenosine(37)-N6)-methyltransferase TrmO n=1 Tax=Desulfosarcina sp. TaxID=2027861 RepID=UPI00356A6B08
MRISFTAIGIIQTPFTDIAGMPIQPSGATNVPGQLVLDAQYEEGLADLNGFSHLILLYHFHLSKGYSLTVKPFLDTVERGLFSTRAPRRPNPIGLSIVRLDRIDGCILHVLDVDMLDGTPLLDIKPYVPTFDMRSDARAGWLEQSQERSASLKSDQRFREKK